MTATGNRALVQRYYEDLWNSGNVAVADEILSSTFTFYPPDAPEGLRGRATHTAYVELHRSAFPDLHVTLTDVLGEGDRVAVQCAGGRPRRWPQRTGCSRRGCRRARSAHSI